MAGRFYVTTPIYYVNDAPHLGQVAGGEAERQAVEAPAAQQVGQRRKRHGRVGGVGGYGFAYGGGRDGKARQVQQVHEGGSRVVGREALGEPGG